MKLMNYDVIKNQGGNLGWGPEKHSVTLAWGETLARCVTVARGDGFAWNKTLRRRHFSTG